MAHQKINPTIVKNLKSFKQHLKRNRIKVLKMYLFGSYAKGRAKSYSDIDVAIITPNISGDVVKDYVTLRSIGRNIDLRIEPHAFKPEEFADRWHPLAAEIKNHGILI